MAMRPAGSGAAGQRRPAASTRQGGVIQPVYVDFKPISKWKQEKEADILLIYLPGFLRQNLRLSTEGPNVVRAKGEQLDGGNRWSRFQEDFQVPERCDIRALRARFEGGVLAVTMPWAKDWIQHQSQEPRAEATQLPPKHTPEGPIDSTPQMVRADDDDHAPSEEPIRPKPPTQKPLSTADEKHSGVPDDRMVRSKKPEDEKMDKQTDGRATASTSSDYGLRNYKEAVKSPAELKGGRQLLVNVGAALLVIVALGTFIITSRLGSGNDN